MVYTPAKEPVAEQFCLCLQAVRAAAKREQVS